MTPSARSRAKIGIDARFFRTTTGGIGRYSRELIPRILSLDTESEYVLFVTPEDIAEVPTHFPNLRVVPVPVSHYSVKEQTAFLRILNQEACDLVHFTNLNHPVLYRRPFVATVHDLTQLHVAARRRLKDRARFLGFQLTLKRLAARAVKVIAVSEATAHDIERHLGLGHARIEVIANGGPAPITNWSAGGRERVAQYLGTRDPYLLFLSQWKPHKGILTLLEAFERFKEATGAPHRLALVGRPSNAAPEVRRYLQGMPDKQQVLTPGFVPDELLHELFHYASAAVVPSTHEGFGLGVLDAFATGTPVVCSDIDVLTEVAGSAGITFPVGDAPALAERLEQVVSISDTQRKQFAKLGYQQLARFTWDHAAEQTLTLYQSLLRRLP